MKQTEHERMRLWIKTHLQHIERPDQLEDYRKAFRWIENHKKSPRQAYREGYEMGEFDGGERMKKEILSRAKELKPVDDLDWQFYHYCLGVLGLTSKDKVRLLVIKDDTIL